MSTRSYLLFDTPIGTCGIAWGSRGIACVQLPEGSEGKTRERLRRRFPEAREARPPAEVQGALDGVLALLSGRPADLSAVTLDMEGVPPFHRRVYEVARTIPRGTTLSYGEVAARLGGRGSARAVGQALGRNPFAVVVPCHRVLAAGGRPGGFSAAGGAETKLRLLAIEGAAPARAPSLFQPDVSIGFDAGAAVEHLRAADPQLARLIDAVGPFAMGLRATPSLFAALAEAIVYQQLSGKAAATIFGRVRALFPRAPAAFTPGRLLLVPDDALRAAGLSRPKLLALRDLAERADRGAIPTLAAASSLPDEELVERLTEVRGIGRWTVEMLLMFRLGRPDVLPVDDLGIRKGFALAFRRRGLPEPAQVERRGARWRPYRTVASWYLWRANELPRDARP